MHHSVKSGYVLGQGDGLVGRVFAMGLNSISRTDLKLWSMLACACDLRTGEVKDAWSLLTGQSSLSVSSRPGKGLCLQKPRPMRWLGRSECLWQEPDDFRAVPATDLERQKRIG